MGSAHLYRLLLSFTIFAAVRGMVSSRIANGLPVDTMSRFPWQVSIGLEGGPFNCSGTIIAKRFVLTAATCVAGDSRTIFKLSFNRLYKDLPVRSYSILVERSAVIDYPPGDYLALIKLPISLELSNEVALAKYTVVNLIDNSLVVMAGFSNTSTQLTYGMFQVLSRNECVAKDNEFNQYLQLCTRSYGYTAQVPCVNNLGGGLFVNWPTNPILVGVLTDADANCSGQNFAVYTYLRPYLDWINDVLRYM